MKRASAVALATLLFASPCFAQQADGDLAKQAQNPIANLISVPLQNNTNINMGLFDRNQNVLNIQPVIPFNFGGLNLITRTIVPIIYRPELLQESGGTSGLGDINASFFFSPADSGALTWGIGPAIVLPTATHRERPPTRGFEQRRLDNPLPVAAALPEIAETDREVAQGDYSAIVAPGTAS